MLLLGPLLYGLAALRRATGQMLDGFVLITLAGIVCLHIVPDAWRSAGPVSLVFILLGLAFPLLLEWVFSQAHERAHLVVLLVAAIGIALHAVLDGLALLPIGEQSGLFGSTLALGVIIHRLPVGIAIWWVVRPQFGTAAALAVFAVVIGATGTSYYLGAGLLVADSTALAFFQAFVAGSLVHVALFGISHDSESAAAQVHGEAHTRHSQSVRETGDSWPFRVGLLLGLIMVFLLPHIPA
jgi:zinc transporter ZupT